jgi:hypothetical protein
MQQNTTTVLAAGYCQLPIPLISMPFSDSKQSSYSICVTQQLMQHRKITN